MLQRIFKIVFISFVIFANINSSVGQIIIQKEQFLEGFDFLVLPSSREINSSDLKVIELAGQILSNTLKIEGLSVKNYEDQIKILEEKYKTRNGLIDNAFDLLIENAHSDILIYYDLSIDSIGNEISVSLSLRAIDRFTGQIYSVSNNLTSTERYWTNLRKPIAEALVKNNGLNEFVNRLNVSLKGVVEKGRILEFSIENNHDEFDVLGEFVLADKTLSELIVNWVEKNKDCLYIKTKGATSNFLRFETKIVTRDKNASNPAFNFASRLNYYLKQTLEASHLKGVLPELEVIGSRIRITIE